MVSRAWCLCFATACRFGFEGPVSDDATTVLEDADVGIDPDTSDIDALELDALVGTSVTMTFGASADTYISGEATPVDERGLNYGTDDRLRVRRSSPRNALLRVDIASLAPCTVTAADLTLTVTVSSDATISARVVLESWIEGSLDGNTGVASWLGRTPAASWTMPGAEVPGSSSAAFTTFSVGTLGPVVIPIPSAIAQAWIDTPATNQGIMLSSDSDDDTRFAPRESNALSERPVLTVHCVRP